MNNPRPPSFAIAIAILASVTVSIAALIMGMFSEICRVSFVFKSTFRGSTFDLPGMRRTSSKS